MENELGFIIPSYCDSDLHLTQLNKCIQSIRKFHPNEKIIIIDDYSTVNIDDVAKKFDNISVVLSPSKGAGDMVTYKVFRDNHVFEKAVIIQDSMNIERRIDKIESLDKIQYLWYFTNHRVHWTGIEEPQNEYNVAHNIKNHDDLVLHCIDVFVKKEEFKKFAKDMYHQKDKWSGCFGCLSVVNYSFLEELNNKTDIIDILPMMNNNRLRRAAESVFALACLYVLGQEVFEKAYDGIYYDGINIPNGRGYLKASDIGLGDYDVTIEQCCKNDYFSKISFNRNV